MTDAKTDIAVLKIAGEGGGYPALELADSDSLEVGDLVLAIGNPFGVGQTVTSGIVSGLARTQVGKSDSQYFIQTDAAINPGNSGGALVDMDGRLVGINTAIFSRSGGSQGVGFAIPSNLVKPFIVSAITGEKVKRPWLGARLQPMTREITDALGLARVEGAFVAAVFPNSPAEAAGLQREDVIINADGHTVEDPRALNYRLTTAGVGQQVSLRYIRRGEERETTLLVKEAPGVEAAEQREIKGANPFDGSRVAIVTQELASELGRNDLADSVVITAVEGGSIAQGFGLQPGDVILRVNGKRIDTVEELEAVLRNPRSLWRLDIRRGNRLFQLAVPG
jgi:Do/DeqQ family serine protease